MAEVSALRSRSAQFVFRTNLKQDVFENSEYSWLGGIAPAASKREGKQDYAAGISATREARTEQVQTTEREGLHNTLTYDELSSANAYLNLQSREELPKFPAH